MHIVDTIMKVIPYWSIIVTESRPVTEVVSSETNARIAELKSSVIQAPQRK